MSDSTYLNTKQERSRFRRQHTLVFCAAWLVVFAVPLMGMLGIITAGDPMGWNIVQGSWLNLLPYFVVSAVSELVLIPIFFNRHRVKAFVAGMILLLGTFAVYENHTLTCFHSPRPKQENVSQTPKRSNDNRQRRHKARPAFMAMPVLTRLSIAMLIVGCGLGLNLLSKYREERRRMRTLEKYHLEQELAGLRAQISPHFFMNMLNNIHSTMETDVTHAQDMLLKMSALMRYVTYDSSLDHVSLERELTFIRNYISLMADRYPADRVSISTTLPPDDSCRHYQVPTMIFITFVENAFKHGVSYRRHSSIDISLTIDDSTHTATFVCINTLPPAKPDSHNHPTEQPGGVGLANVRRRLEMLYGDDFTLDAGPAPDARSYNVILTIPL